MDVGPHSDLEDYTEQIEHHSDGINSFFIPLFVSLFLSYFFSA